MKNKVLTVILLICLSISLIACGKKDEQIVDFPDEIETDEDNKQSETETNTNTNTNTESTDKTPTESENTSSTEGDMEEDTEIDYSKMKSVTLGTLTVRYDETYYKSRSGATLRYYADYLSELGGMYESMASSVSNTDASCYGSHPEFEEDGAVTPIWQMYAKNIEASATITENCVERGVYENYSWGRYYSLPEEMKEVLNEVIRSLYDEYFMLETELGSNLKGPSDYYENVDSLLRSVEYRNMGPTSYTMDDGTVVESYGDRESFSWNLDPKNFTAEEWPVEKYHYFSIETENGTEYYCLNIIDTNASQLISTNNWFSLHGITAIHEEYADVYNSFINLEMTIYRYYEN